MNARLVWLTDHTSLLSTLQKYAFASRPAKARRAAPRQQKKGSDPPHSHIRAAFVRERVSAACRTCGAKAPQCGPMMLPRKVDEVKPLCVRPRRG